MNARARIAMSPNRYSRNRQSGVALLFALLTLLVLSTLAAAVIFATEAENWSSSNYQRMLQARYAAEAGAQNTLNWLVYNYSAPTMSAGLSPSASATRRLRPSWQVGLPASSSIRNLRPTPVAIAS